MDSSEKLTNRFNFIKTETESKMVMIDYDINWIQFLKNQGYNLYYKKYLIPQLQGSIESNTVIVDSFLSTDIRTLGFLKELFIERTKGKFIMPLFALEVNPGHWRITCGNSRALVNYTFNSTPEDYEVVYISRNGPPCDGCTEITNLKEFESIFDIAWMDYSIGFSKSNNDFRLTSSIISHTLYDNNSDDQTLKFGLSGERCYDFWKRFIENQQKISINITCTAKSKELLIVDSMFDVNWNIQEQVEFNFRWMLERYQNEGLIKLYCLISDITEPFKLHSLIPFAHRDCTGYHTEDKKLALISPYVRTSFQILPNIVK